MSYSLDEKTILRASTGVFHNRVTLNDSTLLGGNPPFQPMVTISNGSVDNPSGGGAAAAATCRSPCRRRTSSSSTRRSYMWSAGVQREIPFGFIVDADLCRPARPLPAAGAQHQPAAGGTLRPTPASNIAALRPYKGYGVIRISENSGQSMYNSLQLSADRRYSQRPEGRRGVHARQVRGQRAATSATCCGTPTTTRTSGGRRASTGRTCCRSPTSTTCRSGASPTNLVQNILGGWQISGATFIRTGTPFSITRADDRAGVGDGSIGQPVDIVGDPDAGYERPVLDRHGQQLRLQPGGVRSGPGRCERFGNSTRNILYGTRAISSGTSRSSRTSLSRGRTGCSCARRSSTSRTIRT